MGITWAKATILASCVVMVAIRAPHGQRSRSVKVVRSAKGLLEKALLTFAMVAFFVPLIWVFSPLLAFADYPFRPVPFGAGVVLLGVGLWLFFRAHADLGTNWSITLEVREQHRLVTHGVYRRIRHPMYLSLLLYAIGQALAAPNWIAGPSYLVAMLPLVALRLGPEERMMRATFGTDYEAYAAASRRLIPGIW